MATSDEISLEQGIIYTLRVSGGREEKGVYIGNDWNMDRFVTGKVLHLDALPGYQTISIEHRFLAFRNGIVEIDGLHVGRGEHTPKDEDYKRIRELSDRLFKSE